MTETPVRFLFPVPHQFISTRMALFACAVFFLNGCGVRKHPNIPWATAIQVRPVQQMHSVTSDASEDPLPDLRMDLPPFPPRLMPARSAPARPHVAASPSGNDGADVEKTEAPLLAPQLSAQETIIAQREANQSLAAAGKNLAAAHGKNLNATQADLVSKIQGFLKDARDAAQHADWGRARSLAKKAQVLSEELSSSL